MSALNQQAGSVQVEGLEATSATDLATEIQAFLETVPTSRVLAIEYQADGGNHSALVFYTQ